ncbi:MAG: hypothetical protein RIQ68_1359 [Pseudomonadota bacterium]
MGANRHFGAKRGVFRMKRGSRCSAREKGLKHKRIEGEGREPLQQHLLKSGPRLAHGLHRAPKSRGGQDTRADVMGNGHPLPSDWRPERQLIEKNGRSERIRTSDPLVPNEVRYQAALHSDIWRGVPAAGEGPYSDAGTGGQGPEAPRGPDFPLSCRLVFLGKG